jgi:hypothetical protein
MAKEKLECSFCGRKPDTSLLIAGIDCIYVINVLSRHMELFRRIEINGSAKN